MKKKITTTSHTTDLSAVKNLKIVFFGTPEFSVAILNELKKADFMPTLVVTNPDRPKGRGLVLTPPPVKDWATKHSIDVLQPATLKDPAFLANLMKSRWDLFIVAAYGKIIPKEIIELPLHNTLNVHPSLLPKYRGSSPIQSQILEDEKGVGVSIMILDELMDHGPVIASETVAISNWPVTAAELEAKLATIGGALLAKSIPQWINRDIEAVPQDHHMATFSKKITKADGLINLADDPYQNFLKIQAFAGWPGAYFFEHENSDSGTVAGATGAGTEIKAGAAASEGKKRVIIKEARYSGGQLEILTVIPEGKKEMSYADYLKKNLDTEIK